MPTNIHSDPLHPLDTLKALLTPHSITAQTCEMLYDAGFEDIEIIKKFMGDSKSGVEEILKQIQDEDRNGRRFKVALVRFLEFCRKRDEDVIDLTAEDDITVVKIERDDRRY